MQLPPFLSRLVSAYIQCLRFLAGLSMAIIVVVMMDMMSQIQSYLMSRQYESLMKKSSLVGGMGMPR